MVSNVPLPARGAFTWDHVKERLVIGAAAQAEIEQISSMVRQEWARQHIVEGTSDFLIDYSSAIAAKIQDEKLRSLPLLQEC